MAIGKVDAYATVETPNVNFGDIAVNAQKFQTAGLDRIKDMIPKETKKDKITPMTYDAKTSNIGTIEALSFNLVKDAVDLNYQASESGDYITAKRAENTVKTMNAVKDSLATSATALAKNMPNVSGIESDRIDVYTNLVSGRNTDGKISENGDISIWALEHDDKGNVLAGEDGKPIRKKFRDSNGNEMSDMSSYYIVNQLGTDFITKQDVNKESEMFAKATGMVETSTENGTVTIKRKEVTNENLADLNTSIMSRLKGDRKYMMDVWNQANPEVNKEKKKEYSNDDYKQAQKFLYDETRRRFDSSYTKSVDEPHVTNVNVGGKEDEKLAYLTSNVSVKQKDYKGAKWSYGYEIPIRQSTDKIFLEGIKVQVKSTGYDKKSKRFYIAYNVPESEAQSKKIIEKVDGKSNQTGSQSLSTKGTDSRYVWLNGEGANVTKGAALARNIVGSDGKTYDSIEELIDDVKAKDPKGMFFSGKSEQSNKQTVVKGGNIR